MKIIINILFYCLIIIGILIHIGCDEDNDALEVEIYIDNVFRSMDLGGAVNVRYRVENLDLKNINGWNVYFRVSMESGKQVEAFDGLTYDLEPGQLSNKLIARGKIPEHYDDTDQPITASLQFIEVY